MALATSTLIGLGIGAALGAEKNREAQQQRSEILDANKNSIKFSPWLGDHEQAVPKTNAIGDIAGTAAAGAAAGSTIGGAAAPAAAPGTAVGGTGTTSFSLTGPATNSSPYSLLGAGADANPSAATLGVAAPGAGMASSIPSVAGSAGALGGAGMSPWLKMNPYDMNQDPMSVFGGKQS